MDVATIKSIKEKNVGQAWVECDGTQIKMPVIGETRGRCSLQKSQYVWNAI